MKQNTIVFIAATILFLFLSVSAVHQYSRRSYRRLLNASCSGDVAEVQALLEKGAGWRPFNQGEYDMALARAMECQKYEVAQMLLDGKAPEGMSMSDLLCFVIARRDADSVVFLLNYGVQPNADEFHPLIVAIAVQSLDIMRLLISRGVDVNSYDAKRNTPLLEAVAREDYDAARLLLEAGANPNLPSSDAEIMHPINIAVLSGNVPIFQLLLEHGAVLSGVSFPDSDDPVNIIRAAELSKNSEMKSFVQDALRQRAEETISQMESEASVDNADADPESY
jgi:ankyrin repeat protein